MGGWRNNPTDLARKMYCSKYAVNLTPNTVLGETCEAQLKEGALEGYWNPQFQGLGLGITESGRGRGKEGMNNSGINEKAISHPETGKPERESGSGRL